MTAKPLLDSLAAAPTHRLPNRTATTPTHGLPNRMATTPAPASGNSTFGAYRGTWRGGFRPTYYYSVQMKLREWRFNVLMKIRSLHMAMRFRTSQATLAEDCTVVGTCYIVAGLLPDPWSDVLSKLCYKVRLDRFLFTPSDAAVAAVGLAPVLAGIRGRRVLAPLRACILLYKATIWWTLSTDDMITMARGMINESYRVGCGRVLHAAVTRQYWFADFPWHDAHENDAIVVARTTSHANDAIVVVGESALPVDDAVVGLLLTAESLVESPAEGRDEKIAVEFVDALTGRSHIYTMRTTDCFAAAFRSCEVMVEPRSLGSSSNPSGSSKFCEGPRPSSCVVLIMKCMWERPSRCVRVATEERVGVRRSCIASKGPWRMTVSKSSRTNIVSTRRAARRCNTRCRGSTSTRGIFRRLRCTRRPFPTRTSTL